MKPYEGFQILCTNFGHILEGNYSRDINYENTESKKIVTELFKMEVIELLNYEDFLEHLIIDSFGLFFQASFFFNNAFDNFSRDFSMGGFFRRIFTKILGLYFAAFFREYFRGLFWRIFWIL